MQTGRRFALSAVLTVVIAGCAGSLKVYAGERKETVRMPFRVAEVFVKWGWRDKAAKGGNKKCVPVQFHETLSLPTGPQYFVNVRPSSFAKTNYSVGDNENGSVKEVACGPHKRGQSMTASANGRGLRMST